MCGWMDGWIDVCMYGMCMYVCMYGMCVCVCMCVCVHVRACVCVHAYVCIWMDDVFCVGNYMYALLMAIMVFCWQLWDFIGSCGLSLTFVGFQWLLWVFVDTSNYGSAPSEHRPTLYL